MVYIPNQTSVWNKTNISPEICRGEIIILKHQKYEKNLELKVLQGFDAWKCGGANSVGIRNGTGGTTGALEGVVQGPVVPYEVQGSRSCGVHGETPPEALRFLKD